MSAVFCGQALASTESATSGQSANSQCLSALPGRLGRGKFVLDGLGWKDKNQRTCHSYSTTAWFVSILSVAVLLCLLTRGEENEASSWIFCRLFYIFIFPIFEGKKKQIFLFSVTNSNFLSMPAERGFGFTPGVYCARVRAVFVESSTTKVTLWQ